MVLFEYCITYFKIFIIFAVQDRIIMTAMWALIDCNSFFASCEKVFAPGLRGKPVCVLSSNDGCIVALTPEAKVAGLRRGDPIFKSKEIVERNGVRVFSSNMTLYAAMSDRVTSIIRRSVERVEKYSIDESFADLQGYGKTCDLEAYMRAVADRIRLWTDIPVSVGVAPTKTLAKVGSKFAKKYPGYRSVCMIDSEEKRRKALELFDLADVWGVGRRSFEKLLSLGVRTPLELADRPAGWVKRHFTKPLFQTWLELNGHSCISTEEVLERQTICTSRSFGSMVSDLDSLKASVSTFASSCANKLRAQGSVAGCVTVFVCSNPFREDLEQYSNVASFCFMVPTCDTLEIVAAALSDLERIFIPGISYKRAGVTLSRISPACRVQLDLFDPVRKRPERAELSKALDGLNRRYGCKTVGLAVEGGRDEPWKVKSEHRSGNYLTDLSEILTVHI